MRQVLAAVALAAVLVALAVLQYRWLGEVNAAERDRMRANLQTRATDFARAFDGEITSVFATFHVDPERLDANPAATLAESYTRWENGPHTRGLVKAIFIVNPADADRNVAQQFSSVDARIATVPMPPELRNWLERLGHGLPAGGGAASPLLMADAVDGALPALVIAVPHVRRTATNGQLTVLADPASLARAVVVELDLETLRQVVRRLVMKYFGDADYLVTVVRRDDPSHVIFADDPRVRLDENNADATAGVFDLRMEEVTHAVLPPRGPAPDAKSKLSITIVRRASGADRARLLLATADGQGAWKVFARYRRDSLDALVAASRRRNFAIVLAVLALLGGSVALTMASAERARRLARQQMEFVASVSHELRTPISVIRSAGENLADRVVSEPAQVQRYGAMIETEGRRLSDMVERVLLFAGIGAGMRSLPLADVDVTPVIRDAAAAVEADARDRGVRVNVRAVALPTLAGDADALRSAIQNVIGNAVKYSRSGQEVDVSAEMISESGVRILVVDRGIGIDAADLPHVFKPFYRGRRAVDAQVRGSGIGLSLVRHVVREHGGDVRVESAPDEGTRVTIALPVRTAAEAGERRGPVVRFKQASARL